MCLILFAHQVHPDYPLVLAANRDETYGRPTAAAAFWTDDARIYGGRDLVQGGTWLGVSTNGAVGAVTNYRAGDAIKTSSRSRGELVANYLRGTQQPAEYLEHVYADAGQYNGFNLIAGNVRELHYLSNRGDAPAKIPPGVHGLSNHLLNTDWPKVRRGKETLATLLVVTSQALIDGLFGLLAERTIAPDDILPATGVGIARERILSPAFIASSGYGTRSSTVILVDNQGEVTIIERSFGAAGADLGMTSGGFALDKATTSAAA